MHGFGLYYVLFVFFLWHTLRCSWFGREGYCFGLNVLIAFLSSDRVSPAHP
jgi:hypothetical protein